jgi:hypothetical protein
MNTSIEKQMNTFNSSISYYSIPLIEYPSNHKSFVCIDDVAIKWWILAYPFTNLDFLSIFTYSIQYNYTSPYENSGSGFKYKVCCQATGS